MTLEQAEQFCRWAHGRLPTAEEWEYAAKGGQDVNYSWGDAPVDGEKANFSDVQRTSHDRNIQHPDVWDRLGFTSLSIDDGYPFTAPVGSYPKGAGRFGLLDMTGNVSEWTSTKTDDTHAVVKGGSWRTGPATLSLGSLLREDIVEGASDDIGFRCAR